MSIRKQILQLEAAGKLTRYVPPRTRLLARRRVFLTADALQDLTDRSKSAVLMLTGLGPLHGALRRWVLGERVYGDKTGDHCFLKRLEPPPPEIWEIRVTESVVHARLFGRFAEQDTLVLTKFHTRGFLGDKGSPAWSGAMAGCEMVWNQLFPSTQPHTGSTVHDFVSENCDDYPIG